MPMADSTLMGARSRRFGREMTRCTRGSPSDHFSVTPESGHVPLSRLSALTPARQIDVLMIQKLVNPSVTCPPKTPIAPFAPDR